MANYTDVLVFLEKLSSSFKKVSVGYNSYANPAWRPLADIRELEVEKGNEDEWQCFHENERLVEELEAIWVTVDPRAAVMYKHSAEFGNFVIAAGEVDSPQFLSRLDSAIPEEQEDRDDFLDDMYFPETAVSEIDLNGAYPVIQTMELFGLEFLYARPKTRIE